MKVIQSYPPNIKQIRQVLQPTKDTVFTYGQKIYSPSQKRLSVDLLIHEKTHMLQQSDNPELWWKRYLEEPSFRLRQEVEAYQAQYRIFAMRNKNPKIREAFLHKIASDLSSDLYGKMITYEIAKELIQS